MHIPVGKTDKRRKGRVALDLGEVTIAGLAGVGFLARCEQTGIKIQNCPAYIREWISREHGAW